MAQQQRLNDWVQNKDVQPEDNPVLLGNFGPVDAEQTLQQLKVEGEIPAALRGTLLRTGPNPVDPGANYHWFTGDGMLHAIKLGDGQAHSYRNRWVRTASLTEKNGLEAAPVSATELMIQGSGNVNVVQHGDRVLALPEIGLPYEMDIEANTLRMFDYDGKLASNMTAHPKIDGKTGEMLFFGYELFAPFLRYHQSTADGALAKSVEIDLPHGVMMHDFGVTATRVIFMDLPVRADFSVMEQGFGMPFQWSDEHQSRLGVMDRSSTEDTVTWIDIDPCYVFHPMNCYDDGDRIVMDVIRYEKVFTAPGDNDYDSGSRLERWLVDPTARTVEQRIISDIDQEFPRVNPRCECHPHRYGYSLMTGGEHGFRGLLKYDFENNTTEQHAVGDHCAGGEPVFVSTGAAEDEGYILSVVYNGEDQLSELHIIDARNFAAAPVAVVKLGARVPFGFHGNFCTST